MGNRQNQTISRIFLTHAWIVWLVLIWILSSLPSKSLPSIKIISFDKLAHIVVYLVLGLLFNAWLKSRGTSHKGFMIAYGCLCINALIDEAHQYFIPGRSVSCYDLLCNLSGLIIAYIQGNKSYD